MTQIPSFIYKKKNQITMVLFVPLFALLFILIYKPLDFDTLDEKLLPWLNIAYDLKITLLSIVIVLIGMAVAAVSRMIMTSYAKRHPLSYVKYIAWVALEILIMVMIYTAATYFLIDLSGGTTLSSIFRNTLREQELREQLARRKLEQAEKNADGIEVVFGEDGEMWSV